MEFRLPKAYSSLQLSSAQVLSEISYLQIVSLLNPPNKYMNLLPSIEAEAFYVFRFRLANGVH